MCVEHIIKPASTQNQVQQLQKSLKKVVKWRRANRPQPVWGGKQFPKYVCIESKAMFVFQLLGEGERQREIDANQ